MTDEVGSLVLEHLRPIRVDLGGMKDEGRTMRAELTALRHEVRAVSTLAEQCLEDIATIRVRLDRIERRLDLVDAPK